MQYNTYQRKIIIFDLDGTLYDFKEGSFRQSDVYKKVIENTENYIAKKLGMKTVFVGKKTKPSVVDYTIKNILEIERALNSLK